jgi:hypothetical protein
LPQGRIAMRANVKSIVIAAQLRAPSGDVVEQRLARCATHTLEHRLIHARYAARSCAQHFRTRADGELTLTRRAAQRKISQNHVAHFFGIRTTTH